MSFLLYVCMFVCLFLFCLHICCLYKFLNLLFFIFYTSHYFSRTFFVNSSLAEAIRAKDKKKKQTNSRSETAFEILFLYQIFFSFTCKKRKRTVHNTRHNINFVNHLRTPLFFSFVEFYEKKMIEKKQTSFILRKIFEKLYL